MPELIAKTPCAGLHLPLSPGRVTLSEWLPGRMTSVAPFAGAERKVATNLKKLGLSFPAPNGMLQSGQGRIVWTGRGQAFLIGADPAPGLAESAALTDQSDGWAGLRLEGTAAADVLARLVPLDLRLSAMPAPSSARSLLGHMTMVLMRPAPDRFELLVFRSMARTAVHELAEAMRELAARG